MPKMDAYARGFFRSRQIPVLDVKPLELRGDAHAPYDCMHYCAPGAVQLFARLLQHHLCLLRPDECAGYSSGSGSGGGAGDGDLVCGAD